MKQPTYQQMSELYKELWQLQRDYEESEKKCKTYKDNYFAECEYTDHLNDIIAVARLRLLDGNVEEALEVLNRYEIP